MAICVMDDVLEHSPAGGAKYAGQVLPLLLAGCADRDANVRQCSVYGLGCAAQHRCGERLFGVGVFGGLPQLGALRLPACLECAPPTSCLPTCLPACLPARCAPRTHTQGRRLPAARCRRRVDHPLAHQRARRAHRGQRDVLRQRSVRCGGSWGAWALGWGRGLAGGDGRVPADVLPECKY